MRVCLAERAGFGIDNTQRTGGRAVGQPDRTTGIEADMRRAIHQRIITKPFVAECIRDDKRRVA